MKILMVCLGNICRSPLAEGILRQMVEREGLTWEVDSAGTGSWHIGERPDPRSVAVAARNGVDITGQRARQFRPEDFGAFDLILTMDENNFRTVSGLAPAESDREKVRMIMDFVEPGANRSVPDPYWDDDGFEQVFRMLRGACRQLVRRAGNGTLDPAGR